MDNYEFCADFAAKHGGRALDYGCGRGEIVKHMLTRNVDAFGCDVYYPGVNYKSKVSADLLDTRIRQMEGDRIPFDDNHFDVVTNNQVFEHVRDMETAVREIARVTKPGGIVLSLFPDREIWREGHVRIPFIHWFGKGNRARVYYALPFHVLGICGGRVRTMPLMQGCEWTAEWLDKWTFYRPYSEIRDTFARHLSAPEHMEAHWLAVRKPHAAWLPAVVRSFITRKWSGMVFTCQKPYGVS